MIYPNDNANSMFVIGLSIVVVCGIITRAKIQAPEIAGSGGSDSDLQIHDHR
jgi:hypothetical protein